MVRIQNGITKDGAGFLIRNPTPGGNPFVLTAFHTFDFNRNNVLEPDDEVINNFVEFRFDDNSPCGATIILGPQARGPTMMSGAILRAASPRHDFVLLELRSPAPFTANYARLKFTRDQQGSLFIIHHPGPPPSASVLATTTIMSTAGRGLVTLLSTMAAVPPHPRAAPYS